MKTVKKLTGLLLVLALLLCMGGVALAADAPSWEGDVLWVHADAPTVSNGQNIWDEQALTKLLQEKYGNNKILRVDSGDTIGLSSSITFSNGSSYKVEKGTTSYSLSGITTKWSKLGTFNAKRYYNMSVTVEGGTNPGNWTEKVQITKHAKVAVSSDSNYTVEIKVNGNTITDYELVNGQYDVGLLTKDTTVVITYSQDNDSTVYLGDHGNSTVQWLNGSDYADFTSDGAVLPANTTMTLEITPDSNCYITGVTVTDANGTAADLTTSKSNGTWTVSFTGATTQTDYTVQVTTAQIVIKQTGNSIVFSDSLTVAQIEAALCALVEAPEGANATVTVQYHSEGLYGLGAGWKDIDGDFGGNFLSGSSATEKVQYTFVFGNDAYPDNVTYVIEAVTLARPQSTLTNVSAEGTAAKVLVTTSASDILNGGGAELTSAGMSLNLGATAYLTFQVNGTNVYISDIQIDGQSILDKDIFVSGSVIGYEFTPTAENHTIKVTTADVAYSFASAISYNSYIAADADKVLANVKTALAGSDDHKAAVTGATVTPNEDGKTATVVLTYQSAQYGSGTVTVNNVSLSDPRLKTEIVFDASKLNNNEYTSYVDAADIQAAVKAAATVKCGETVVTDPEITVGEVSYAAGEQMVTLSYAGNEEYLPAKAPVSFTLIKPRATVQVASDISNATVTLKVGGEVLTTNTVDADTEVTINAKPADGYYIESITVTDATLNDDVAYAACVATAKFNAVAGKTHTVNVEAKAVTLTVNSTTLSYDSAAENATDKAEYWTTKLRGLVDLVAPADAGTLTVTYKNNSGNYVALDADFSDGIANADQVQETVKFTWTPNEQGKYPVVTSGDVTVTLSKQTSTITINVDDGATVTGDVTATGSVLQGSPVAITITPKNNKYITSATVNGATVTPVNGVYKVEITAMEAAYIISATTADIFVSAIDYNSFIAGDMLANVKAAMNTALQDTVNGATVTPNEAMMAATVVLTYKSGESVTVNDVTLTDTRAEPQIAFNAAALNERVYTTYGSAAGIQKEVKAASTVKCGETVVPDAEITVGEVSYSAGEQTVTLTYAGNANYKGCTATATFTLVEPVATVTLGNVGGAEVKLSNVTNGKANMGETVTITAVPANNTYVTAIKVNGSEQTVSCADGTATVNFAVPTTQTQETYTVAVTTDTVVTKNGENSIAYSKQLSTGEVTERLRGLINTPTDATANVTVQYYYNIMGVGNWTDINNSFGSYAFSVGSKDSEKVRYIITFDDDGGKYPDVTYEYGDVKLVYAASTLTNISDNDDVTLLVNTSTLAKEASITLNQGDTVVLTITPVANNVYIKDVVIDGTSIGATYALGVAADDFTLKAATHEIKVITAPIFTCDVIEWNEKLTDEKVQENIAAALKYPNDIKVTETTLDASAKTLTIKFTSDNNQYPKSDVTLNVTLKDSRPTPVITVNTLTGKHVGDYTTAEALYAELFGSAKIGETEYTTYEAAVESGMKVSANLELTSTAEQTVTFSYEATATHKEASAKATFTLLPAQATVEKASDISNATVTLSASGTVDAGTEVTINAKPADGYYIESITVTDATLNDDVAYAACVATAKFNAVAGKTHTVNVEAKAVTLNVPTTMTVSATATSDGNTWKDDLLKQVSGSEPSGVAGTWSVDMGTDFGKDITKSYVVTFTWTPENQNKYPSVSATSTVSLSKLTTAVNIGTVSGVTVNVNGNVVEKGVTVQRNSKVTVTITPDNNKYITSATVNGQTVTPVNGAYTFTFEATEEAYTVNASTSTIFTLGEFALNDKLTDDQVNANIKAALTCSANDITVGSVALSEDKKAVTVNYTADDKYPAGPVTLEANTQDTRAKTSIEVDASAVEGKHGGYFADVDQLYAALFKSATVGDTTYTSYEGATQSGMTVSGGSHTSTAAQTVTFSYSETAERKGSTATATFTLVEPVATVKLGSVGGADVTLSNVTDGKANMGETVTITAVPANNTYVTAIKVNGNKQTASYKDGTATATLKVEQNEYTVTVETGSPVFALVNGDKYIDFEKGMDVKAALKAFLDSESLPVGGGVLSIYYNASNTPMYNTEWKELAFAPTEWDQLKYHAFGALKGIVNTETVKFVYDPSNEQYPTSTIEFTVSLRKEVKIQLASGSSADVVVWVDAGDLDKAILTGDITSTSVPSSTEVTVTVFLVTGTDKYITGCEISDVTDQPTVTEGKYVYKFTPSAEVHTIKVTTTAVADDREETSIIVKARQEPLTYVFGADEADILDAICAGVQDSKGVKLDGAKVEMKYSLAGLMDGLSSEIGNLLRTSVVEYVGIDELEKILNKIGWEAFSAGQHTVQLSYAGSAEYLPCATEVTFTIDRAAATVEVAEVNANYSGKQINNPIKVVADAPNQKDQVEYIIIVAGLDINGEAYININLPSILGLDMPELLAGKSVTISLKQLSSKLNELLASTDIDNQTINEVKGLVDSIAAMEVLEDATITISMDKNIMPKDSGVYVIGAVISDTNYKTNAALNYAIIKPQVAKGELEFNFNDENFVVYYKNLNNYDFGAHILKDGLTENQVAWANGHIKHLYIGADINGEFVIGEVPPTEIGVYTQIAFIKGLANTDAVYAEPIVRPFVVVSELLDVKFTTDERTFTYDGKAHGLEAAAYTRAGVNVTAQGTMRIYYTGVENDAEINWPTTTRPSESGVYNVTAMFVSNDRTHAGVATTTMLIIPSNEAAISVMDKVHTWNGQGVSVNGMVTSTPADAAKTVITGSIAVDGDFSKDGFSSLAGTINLDFPARGDVLLEKVLDDRAVTAADVLNEVDRILQMIDDELDVELLTTIRQTLAELPRNASLTFYDAPSYSGIGAYLVIGVITDPNYAPVADVGVLVIAPNVTEAELRWNYNDLNGIITRPVLDSIDLNASAYLKNSSEKDAQLTERVEYILVGTDDDGNLIISNSTKNLANGVYTQVAFIREEISAEMMLVKPVIRTFALVAQNVTVTVTDKTVAYDGDAHSCEVTVSKADGSSYKPSALKVTYIGLDAGTGWYNNTMAPTNVGAYLVVAEYEEYSGGDLKYIGGDIGYLTIKPQGEFAIAEKTEKQYDGQPKFVDIISNPANLPYISVISDASNNVNIVFPASWNAPQVSKDGIQNSVNALTAWLKSNVPQEWQNGEVYAELMQTLSGINIGTVTINGEYPIEVGEYAVICIAYGSNQGIIVDRGVLTILPINASEMEMYSVYSVTHYQQQLDGSYLEVTADTQFPLQGKVGEVVTAEPKTYDGYTYNAAKSTASATLLKAVPGTDGLPTYTKLELYYDLSNSQPSVVTYMVIVENGSGSGAYAPGAIVNISAYEMPGMRFVAWAGADDLAFTSGGVNFATSAFIMPARVVQLTATYEPIGVAPDTEADVVITSPLVERLVVVYEGEQAEMAITAVNAVSYQWYVNYGDGTGWHKRGENSPVYVTTPTTLANDGYRYKCVAMGANGSTAESVVFVLQVLERIDVPETGDTTNLAQWGAMMALSFVGCLILMKRKRLV